MDENNKNQMNYGQIAEDSIYLQIMAALFSLGLSNLVPTLVLVHIRDFIHPVKHSSSHEPFFAWMLNE